MKIINAIKNKLRPVKEESRCRTCKELGSCPAAYTGVLYPCPYYKEEPTQ